MMTHIHVISYAFPRSKKIDATCVFTNENLTNKNDWSDTITSSTTLASESTMYVRFKVPDIRIIDRTFNGLANATIECNRAVVCVVGLILIDFGNGTNSSFSPWGREATADCHMVLKH